MAGEGIGFAGLLGCLARLAGERRWVGWRWETRESGKPTKPPRTVIGGRANGFARNDDPATWATFEDARAAQAAGGVEGVGLQILDLKRFAAIDLDDVRNEAGELLPWAADLIARAGSYAEWTPSGAGARIIGRVPRDHASLHVGSTKHPAGGAFELWANASTGRYLTVTGARIDGTPDEARDISSVVAELTELRAGDRSGFRIDTGAADFTSGPADAADVEEVRELLSFVGPDSPYGEWLEMLMALHDHFGEAGLALAEEWSARGAKHVPGEVAAKWRGFKPGGGVKIGTVAERARRGGADLSEIGRRRRQRKARGGDGGRRPQAAAPQNAGPDASIAPAFSDEALALEFARRHEHGLRYVAAWSRWYRWTGQRWEADDTLGAFDLARAVCREAAQGCNKDASAKQLGAAKTVAGVVSLARADRRLAATVDQWDADPWLLNTPGGVVDLRTGEARPTTPSDHMTKITAVAPGGDCPLWRGFLDRVTAGDSALQGYLQRLVGYGLTGSTREHVLPFAHGSGGNGKGVFLGAIAGLMGDYAVTAPIETFAASSGDRHPTELAMLRGARLVTAQETEEGRRWAESRIKSLTGGDRITARFMRADFFEFDPQFTLLIAGNHKPGLRSVDEAIRRRFHLIPFTVTISRDERDERLPEKLKAEWSGILRWAIDGCLAWQRQGLNPPDTILAATSAYLDAQDALGAWLDECCDLDANATQPRSELFASWQAWAEKAREFVLPRARFFDALEARGFDPMTRKGTRAYRGISLKQRNYSDAHWNRCLAGCRWVQVFCLGGYRARANV
jgi:putative DNA primase/helicase